MSSTQMGTERTTQIPATAAVDQKLEVVILPVSDVDRAKAFYVGLGWRLDADFSHGNEWRVMQLTPPGSPCSVLLGKGLTDAAPGSVQGNFLVVDDVEAARADLRARGAQVNEVFHFEGNLLRVTGTQGRLPGPDPQRSSYFSFASFSDPDGNTWLLQEIKTRFPGRGFGVDVATMTDLLKEAEKGHGAYEPTAPKHHWSDWYAAYIVARVQGKTPEQAAREGGLNVSGAGAR